MALPRTFVGFSSTDIRSYWLMCAWKEHEHIDFDFVDALIGVRGSYAPALAEKRNAF